LKKIIFFIKEKIKKNKISFNIYLKGISNIDLKKGISIHSNCSLEATKGNIVIDNNVILNRYVYLKANKGKISIGEGSEINNFTNIDGYGEVEICKNVLIGPNVQIISYQHNYKNINKLIKLQGSVKSKILIEDDVWIGANSVIMAGITIAKGAVIGAGSIVTKNVDKYSVVVGNPAKRIGNRE
jgi:acetyltransferase-like isoleucine patch superfamily enzyme